MTETPFVVDRSPRGLVVVHGPDATSFLQSIVSQDLEPIGIGEGARSLLLTPQGKLDVDFRILRVGEDWWLDTEAENAPRLAASLTRFKIRVKAEIEDRTADTGMLSIVGAAHGDVPAVPYSHRGERGLEMVSTRWLDQLGFDALGPADRVAEELARMVATIEQAPPERFEALRIEAGVPRYGADIGEKTIPQEAFLDVDAISFTKGCFLGQELAARIDSRGHVNRYLRRLTIDGGVVPPAGASVVVGDKEVGAVTSAAAVPGDDRTVALGMVRREVEPPAEVTLRWDGGEASATVAALP